ncbi:hypothetical protein CBS101457_002007 [Exobasidium rhododendri]|nr:hypothetical protein CBS101457_002007 [Exobasidium rhododendri]
MPVNPRTSGSGVSAENIIAGSRKRVKLEADPSSASYNSPASSTSRLPDIAPGDAGPGAEEATHKGFKLLDVLINRIDEDDTPLTVPFLALPSKIDYPDYYQLIKNPISLEQIRRRLQNRQFSSFEQVRIACETVCRNAKRYNVKGSEIYEKSRVMHQIILHVYVDLVEKNEVQPAGSIILRSDPPLEQQSAKLARLEQQSKRARLDYDEVEGQDVVGRVSLRLKKDDDIDYEEDEDDGEGEGKVEASEEVEERQDTRTNSVVRDDGGATIERKTSQNNVTVAVAEEDEMEGDLSSAPNTYEGDQEMQDGSGLDRSMLTLSGKFDRRKRPGPRGKRLKSTLRQLVAELRVALDRSGQPITRFFLALPSRLQYPDYYKVILRPIALDSIEDRVNHKEYINPHALITDLRQMVENAQYFNEEGSEIWEAAEEVRHYVESITVPTLLADGFTLDPNDTRQSAMPIDLAANSSIPSQAAAYRIQTERRLAMENGTSTEMIESVSPEMLGRTLPASSNERLKVRSNTKGNHASPTPALVSDLQPPGLAPSSAGLGLSTNDPLNPNRMMNLQNPYNVAMASPGGHIPGPGYPTQSSSIPATPSSYLVNASQSLDTPSNVLPWAAPNSNSLSHQMHGNPTYFAPQHQHLNGIAQGPNRQLPTSSIMAPPAIAGYPNGALPFQRPTGAQMQQQQQQIQQIQDNFPQPLGGDIASTRPSPPLSKRLPGEASPFDPFQTNVLQLESGSTIVKQAVVSHFDVKVRDKHGGDDKFVSRIRNDVTRMHSINVSLGASEQLEVQVDLTPRNVVQKENGGEGRVVEDRRWTLSIHHNGKGIKPHWQNEERNGVVKKAVEETPASTIAPPTSTSTTRVQVPTGSACTFNFTPQAGANIVNVHIYPPPPNSTLQEIVSNEGHPLRSKAKALLDLPERYRLLFYCRP